MGEANMTRTVAKAVRKAVGDDLVTDQFASAAHEAIDRAAEQIGGAEARARGAAALSVQKFEHAQNEARERLDNTAGRIAEFIRGRPVAAIGLVFIAGTLVGTMLRR
jgi:ElaB/YqjD/DUF883 family membrane-anchored ribosome-binding protein